MDTEEIWRTIESERLQLADLLTSLRPDQWELATPCDGWRVRDVAAHLTIAPRLTLPAMVAGLVRARGSFDRFVYDDAVRHASAEPQVLVDELRRLASSRRHPPPTKPMDPLVDVLVHGQDIAFAVGVPRAMPEDAARAAADHVWRSGFPFRARKRLDGRKLVATNTDWSQGHGAPLEAPIEQLLLAMTGRLTAQAVASQTA